MAGMGFVPEAPKVIFPMELFLAESDLSPIEQKIDEFANSLTKWEPSITGKKVEGAPKVKVVGKDYNEAIFNMNTLFLRNRWGDGLPLLPSTRERIEWILRGTDLSPNTVVGKIMPQGRIATVETLASTLAMAGGRPEYLPVLMACIECIIDHGCRHANWQATSCSAFPVVITNGPIGKQIRLNSGFGLMGPDALYPAGASIGRALRLILQNVGGAIPGVGSMAQFSAMRHTNSVFAEDEAGLPPGWEPMAVEYMGCTKEANIVTVTVCCSVVNVWRRGPGLGETVEEDAIEGLYRMATAMRVHNVNMLTGYQEGTPGVLIFSSVVANQAAKVGWTKQKIKEFLWENTKIPVALLKQSGLIREQWFQQRIKDLDLLEDPFPITAKSRNFMVLVAGGRHPSHGYWMQAASHYYPVSREIKLPKIWDELLKKAEDDLGPIPDN